MMDKITKAEYTMVQLPLEVSICIPRRTLWNRIKWFWYRVFTGRIHEEQKMWYDFINGNYEFIEQRIKEDGK